MTSIRVRQSAQPLTASRRYSLGMGEDLSGFWSAIVQIVPVLALAMVVELRATRLFTLPKNRRESLLPRLIGWITYLSAHILIPGLFVSSEFIGLTYLAGYDIIGNRAVAWQLGMSAVLFGLIFVAVNPILVRLLETAASKDVHIPRRSSQPED